MTEKTETSKAAVAAARRTSLVSAVINLLLVVVKGGLGFLGGSQALIADAAHSLADLTTDILTYAAVHVGRAEADDNHPYGHGKFETFGTLVLAVLLALTGIGIGFYAANSLWHGHYHELSLLAVVAALASVLLNEGLFRYCLYEGRLIGSSAIIANAWHHRADGLSSLAALVGITLALFGWPIFDHLAAAAVAVILCHMAYTMGRDAFDELVDTALPAETQAKMQAIIIATEGVVDCHLLRSRRLGGSIMVDVHVDVDPLISVSEGHRIAELVEYRLLEAEPDASDIIVHIDPASHQHEPPVAAAQPSRKELEDRCRAIVAATCPAAQIKALTLHFIDSDAKADLLLSHPDLSILQQQKAALTEALTVPNGPFKAVSLALQL